MRDSSQKRIFVTASTKRTFPLAEIARAHRVSEDDHMWGKPVLLVCRMRRRAAVARGILMVSGFRDDGRVGTDRWQCQRLHSGADPVRRVDHV
jgi:hypothetical protein